MKPAIPSERISHAALVERIDAKTGGSRPVTRDLVQLTGFAGRANDKRALMLHGKAELWIQIVRLRALPAGKGFTFWAEPAAIEAAEEIERELSAKAG